MCQKCGCNTCETESTMLVLNESKAPATILSEGLKHHIDTNKPLTEHLYRAGSRAYFDLFAEARSLYSRGILEFTHEDDVALLTETNLGHFGLYETVNFEGEEYDIISKDGDWVYLRSIHDTQVGKKEIKVKEKDITINETKVPLDFPIELNEQMDLEDELANMEFGMDYDQLGDNEKEWVRDEMDNMSMNEVTRYSGFNRNPEDPDSEKFEPTGSVAQFKEDLRALFGKFKGDLKNPEFIKGVAQIMVSWKSLLRSQLNESKIPTQDQVDKFFALTQNETHYLNSKPVAGQEKTFNKMEVEPWDEYDLSNWNSLVRKAKDKGQLNEAKKAKKNNKKLNKPMRDSSGGKAYKVYVKDPKTKKIKTVRFGSGGLRAKINDKKARNAFAKRHKCSTKKDKTKAGYWSCRLPRYAKLLGLKSSFSGFW